MTKEFEYNGKAMGTEYFVSVVCNSEELAKKMFALATQNIQSFEERFSRFLPTSELSLLNDKKKMVVSEIFLKATLKAYDLFVETKGIFNPLVQIARFGYDKTFDDIENNKNLENEDYYDIDFNSTLLDTHTSKIHLNRGQKLDFGGFLKGYLAEIIAKKIKNYSENIEGVIVNIGGDIHTQGLDKDGNKFVFNIYNPILNKEDVVVTLHNQSLATSGTYKRKWFMFGKKMHHILDISGKKNPKSNIISASIIHKDGAVAEAYTKVFLSKNYKEALKLFRHQNLSFIVIKTDGTVIKNIQ